MLINDKIFAMVGSMGTATSAATMPLILGKGLPHLFPITPAEMFSTPFEKLKFAYFSPYYDDVRTSLKYLIETKGKKRVGILYQDDEFGTDILRGARTARRNEFATGVDDPFGAAPPATPAVRLRR
jgi:branched-chain amino acid transport system substrate-binding protein